MLRNPGGRWLARAAGLLALLAFAAAGWLVAPARTSAEPAQKPKPSISIVMERDETLQPGTWHGFIVAPSSAQQAYLVEISPLERAGDGAYVQRYLVQPEFYGPTQSWNDVLRVQLPDGFGPLRVNIRVYAVSLTK